MRVMLVTILLLTGLSACSNTPTHRAVEFTKNCYSGKSMRAEEWFTKEARASRLFNDFGGVDAMVKDSTAEATRNQGLQSIKVLNEKKQDAVVLIEVEVVFKNGTKSTGVDSWVIEDGNWKITPAMK